MAYAVAITKSARRQLNRIPNPFRGNIERHIDALSEGPRPPNAISLTADPRRRWRLRVGGWRVLYVIDDRMRTILVTDVLPRGKAYRNLSLHRREPMRLREGRARVRYGYRVRKSPLPKLK